MQWDSGLLGHAEFGLEHGIFENFSHPRKEMMVERRAVEMHCRSAWNVNALPGQPA